MPDPRHHDRPRITVEQLLALKRSERPDRAFWEDFDRELHRRQFASVVSRPAWHVRFARVMRTGLRRAAPATAAAAAAVAGFLVWQHPVATVATVDPAVPAESPRPMIATAEVAPTPVAAPGVARPEVTPQYVERATTGEPRFVVHEFVAEAAPTRTFVAVTSPNTFSSPAFDASLRMVNTLTSGSARRAGLSTEAGSF